MHNFLITNERSKFVTGFTQICGVEGTIKPKIFWNSER